jgi:hypothetical protein
LLVGAGGGLAFPAKTKAISWGKEEVVSVTNGFEEVNFSFYSFVLC